jgi:hypothetical protein
MKLQEAKDKVAKDVYGHPDWDTFKADGLDWRVYRDAADEVAEVYASSKEKEAFEAGFKRGLLESNKPASKSCPNCLSEDVIMFTSDLDICNKCHQTF